MESEIGDVGDVGGAFRENQSVRKTVSLNQHIVIDGTVRTRCGPQSGLA
jgi:hypothetical protein